MKKIWGMVTILGMTVCLLAGCGNDKKAAQDGSTNVENETAMENGTGSGSVISIGDSYYYDLLSSETGDIYALTDGEAENGEKPVFVWKSSDQGENWEVRCSFPIPGGRQLSDGRNVTGKHRWSGSVCDRIRSGRQ